MTDADLLLELPNLSFGSGVVGVCDVCGTRQAVIILQKERFKLCVIDFLNKSWIGNPAKPGAPLPAYRSDRVWFDTSETKEGKAPAITLSPTKAVKRPVILVTPDVYGLTTGVLESGIRLAREGFEVVLPDVAKTSSVGPRDHLSMRFGARGRGVPVESARLSHLVQLFSDALAYARTRDLVDPAKVAVFGASYGGSLAVALAGREPKLSAVVLAYPMPVFPAEYPRLVNVPVLLLGGSRDAHFLKSRRQFEALRPGVEVEVVEFSGARHLFLARDMSGYDESQSEAAWTRIIAFLKSRLLPPPPKPPVPPKVVASPPSPPAATSTGPAPIVAPRSLVPAVVPPSPTSPA